MYRLMEAWVVVALVIGAGGSMSVAGNDPGRVVWDALSSGAIMLASGESRSQNEEEEGMENSLPSSVWQGAYTEEQVERARDAFSENCATCHGSDLEGGESAPSLTGGLFMLHWDESNVGALFDFVRTEMPLGQPGTLSDRAYIDVVALILQANGFPAGDVELPPNQERLENVAIEREPSDADGAGSEESEGSE